MDYSPLISIITPSLNHGEFIKATIQSVLEQDYPKKEYIIVDGCSHDNTIEILQKYNKRVKWISEPDHGQADAINKGLKMAKGDILSWLNSDDILEPGALSKVANHFSKNKDRIMIYSDAHLIDKQGKDISDYLTEEFRLKRLADTCFICQPTVFFRSEVLKEIGLLDITLQTCMDYDYWIRIGKHFPIHSISYLKGTYFASSRIYNENKTVRMRKKVYQENMKIQKKHFGKVSKLWIYGYIKEIILGLRFKIKD
jgi:glycosyltransferase involved in cell wall biosynthesis